MVWISEMLFLDRRNQIIDICNAYPAFRYEMLERRSIHTTVFPFKLQNYPESWTLGMKAEE